MEEARPVSWWYFPLKCWQRGTSESYDFGVEFYAERSEPASYLLIDFHCLFSVVEKELFPRRSQVHIHLEAGVLREFPAVWTTAEGAIKGFRDGCIQQGALRLFGPHTTEKGECKQAHELLARKV